MTPGVRPRPWLGALVGAAVGLVACGPALELAPRRHGALELHYRERRGPAPAAAATRTYRVLAGRLLATRCEMWPSDSRYYDDLRRGCGAVVSTLAAAGRLLIERAASPRFLEPVVFAGQLRWFDPAEPARCD